LQEPEDLYIHSPAKRLEKRLQTSIVDTTSRDTENNCINPIKYWVQERSWPKEYFEQESDIVQQLPKKRSVSSLPGKQSEAGSGIPSTTIPSNQQLQEAKSTWYNRPSYTTVLATKGSFIDKFKLGITKESNKGYQALLNTEQPVPKDLLFCNDLFKSTYRKIQDRNKAIVIRDILLLIVLSAQTLAIYSTIYLDYLIESINKGWKRAIPFYSPCLQPDYSIGFGQSVFTADQLKKLKLFISKVTDTFATYYIAI
jgi:hypothetical protein